jgi:hypothetical protein
MRACKFLTAFVFVGLASPVALAQPRGRLPILDTFQGTVANDKKPELKTTFVATEAEWRAVWAKVNPEGKPPKVDFAKHFLLVGGLQDAADPNRPSTWFFKDDKGVVSGFVTATLIGYKPSGRTVYRFYKVSREGVTGVRRFVPAQNRSVVDPLPK